MIQYCKDEETYQKMKCQILISLLMLKQYMTMNHIPDVQKLHAVRIIETKKDNGLKVVR